MIFILALACAPSPATPEELEGYNSQIEELKKQIDALDNQLDLVQTRMSTNTPQQAVSQTGFDGTSFLVRFGFKHNFLSFNFELDGDKVTFTVQK